MPPRDWWQFMSRCPSYKAAFLGRVASTPRSLESPVNPSESIVATRQLAELPRKASTWHLDIEDMTSRMPLQDRSHKSHMPRVYEGRVADKLTPSKLTTGQKLGFTAACFLWIGLTLILAALGFLWFLWLASHENTVWKSIVTNGWVNRSVVLTTLVIRQSVAYQTAAASAMLACVAIERAVVLMTNLASVSMMRNTNDGPLFLAWWLWKSFVVCTKRWRYIFIPITVTVLVATSMLIQLASFALISDVDLSLIQGAMTTTSRLTTIEYGANSSLPVVTHGSTWGQQPQSFVAFAEHHEAVQNTSFDGIDDTGMTLRAFLPVADQQSRSMTASWDGRANVLDSRVVCVRPKLENPGLHFAASTLALTASFSPDITDKSKIGLVPVDSNINSTFACVLPLQPEVSPATNASSQWQMTICQPAGSNFMLQSALKRPGVTSSLYGMQARYTVGSVYIVLNVSSGTRSEWNAGVSSEDPELDTLRGNGTKPAGYSVHGIHNEWYDLIFSDDAKLNLSVTMCYTAFDTADLHVDVQAASNHSDIAPQWNAKAAKFDYTNIRAQFGQSLTSGSSSYLNSTNQLVARNVMTLSPRQSWIAQADYGDYIVPAGRSVENWIVDYANMFGSYQQQQNFGANKNELLSFTRIMWAGMLTQGMWSQSLAYDYADASIIGLAQEILQAGGSMAFAMQSIVTVLTQTAYYQQIQQLNGGSNVSSTDYVLVLAPVRIRGLVAVTAVVAVHIICTFCVILPCFLWGTTQLSTLGNSWQVVGQLLHQETMKLLNVASLSSDSVVDRVIKSQSQSGTHGKSHNREVVGLRLNAEGSGVELFSNGKASGVDRRGVEMVDTRDLVARRETRRHDDYQNSVNRTGSGQPREESWSLLQQQQHEPPHTPYRDDNGTARLVSPTTMFHRPYSQW